MFTHKFHGGYGDTAYTYDCKIIDRFEDASGNEIWVGETQLGFVSGRPEQFEELK